MRCTVPTRGVKMARDRSRAEVRAWWSEPPDAAVRAAIERLAEADDVARIAVMPDVHLAEDVCVGVVLATWSTLVPAAVGGDIGCGMATLALGVDAGVLTRASAAARVLEGFSRAVPVMRHARRNAPALPPELVGHELAMPALESVRTREAALQLGTLGRGNHFLEVQVDDEGQLWLMVHSGSRGLGSAIRAAHQALARPDRLGLRGLAADSEAGRAYLADAAWALRFADASRKRMIEVACDVMRDVVDARPDPATWIACHHNFVRREVHDDEPLWVHRKGACSAADGEAVIIPGSMGAPSFHAVGQGCAGSMCSSSHGAGRAMSRTDARRRISPKRLHEELRGVWFDHRMSRTLCEEAPGAYKEIGAVMRAQQELVRVVRRVRPLLVFKGG
jgi:tRNA-splicing ligase RtcB